MTLYTVAQIWPCAIVTALSEIQGDSSIDRNRTITSALNRPVRPGGRREGKKRMCTFLRNTQAHERVPACPNTGGERGGERERAHLGDVWLGDTRLNDAGRGVVWLRRKHVRSIRLRNIRALDVRVLDIGLLHIGLRHVGLRHPRLRRDRARHARRLWAPASVQL